MRNESSTQNETIMTFFGGINTTDEVEGGQMEGRDGDKKRGSERLTGIEKGTRDCGREKRGDGLRGG